MVYPRGRLGGLELMAKPRCPTCSACPHETARAPLSMSIKVEDKRLSGVNAADREQIRIVILVNY